MARVQQARTFWKTLKSVSVGEVLNEARHPIAVALIGSPEERQEAMRLLFPNRGREEALPERSLIRAFDCADAESGYPCEDGSFDIVIDARVSATAARPDGPVFAMQDIGGWERVIERILDQRPDLTLSLARRFPGFRPEVAERIIKDTAVANAEFAMLNALPGVVPIIAPLLPAGAIGDILMITKNQAMMLYRLAAIYNLPLDARARARDLAPLLSNALGWRALAREVVGIVPGGIGLAARGAIAYAGTAALGRALSRFYATGQQITRAQINRYYRESYGHAKEVVQQKMIARKRK